MLRLHALGWGLKRIAREFGCSRNTVRRYVAADGWMAYRHRAGADLLFGFISQRYERRSLVVTTNLPCSGTADHRRQLPAGRREAEPQTSRRQEGSPLMAPGRARRMPNALNQRATTTRAVSPDSMTVCSPASRRVTALAGLTAWTPAARTVTGRSCPTTRKHSSSKEDID